VTGTFFKLTEFQVTRLQNAAYTAPCLGSRRDAQHAALMICVATSERNMQLPGAPFVALSLEFFASVSFKPFDIWYS
jgi:hypothetical protein